MRMTYRISPTYISQALDGKFRAKADRYLDRVPDLWEGEGGGKISASFFYLGRDRLGIVSSAHVLFTNVLALSNYNHP